MTRTKSTTPLIGFDRFIRHEWATCALRIHGGVESPEALTARLTTEGYGAASITKTRSVLRGLWLAPRPELTDFADRGFAIWQRLPEISAAALCWGMAIAVYPFFGKVADLMGRLTVLQGDYAAADIHRRLAETYGEGEVTRRAANRVLHGAEYADRRHALRLNPYHH